jgi:hypothetical protein
VKLKVHCITHGRYFKAGEDVPDAPASFARYALVSEDGDAVDRGSASMDAEGLKEQNPPRRRYKLRRPKKKAAQ